jgi:hypothetical protein
MKIEKESTSDSTIDNTDERPELPPKIVGPSTPEKAPRFRTRFSIKRFFATRTKRKIVSAVTLVLVSLLFIVPVTRYIILGTFIKKDYTVSVLDSQSRQPISDAIIRLGDATGKTDKEGKAVFKQMKVGKVEGTITKKYYRNTNLNGFVGLRPKTFEANIVAEGQPIKVKVINKFTQKPIENASITSGESSTTTDNEGNAVLVIAPSQTDFDVKIKAANHNDSVVKLSVADSKNKENVLPLTPTGKIYFLSKQSGKIDVVKTNLDGSERQVVLPGTGFEDDGDTILLASRDWKFLALKTKRDTKKDHSVLYFINTADDQLQTMDEGNATFKLHGWSGSNLIYQVDRAEVETYQNDKYRLKSFNAEAKKLITLDNTTASLLPGGNPEYNASYGLYTGQSYAFVSITDTQVLYIKNGLGYCQNAANGIYTVNNDGAQKKTILEAPTKDKQIESWSAYTYKPGEIYFATTNNACTQATTRQYNEYEFGGKIETIEENEFRQTAVKYSNFLVSPNNQETVWTEARDGKNVIFLGNTDLEQSKEITRLQDFNVYGWFNRDYLLLSKKGSELFIMPRDGGDPVKISDYHKPSYDFRGYGYGYGGL